MAGFSGGIDMELSSQEAQPEFSYSVRYLQNHKAALAALSELKNTKRRVSYERNKHTLKRGIHNRNDIIGKLKLEIEKLKQALESQQGLAVGHGNASERLKKAPEDAKRAREEVRKAKEENTKAQEAYAATLQIQRKENAAIISSLHKENAKLKRQVVDLNQNPDTEKEDSKKLKDLKEFYAGYDKLQLQHDANNVRDTGGKYWNEQLNEEWAAKERTQTQNGAYILFSNLIASRDAIAEYADQLLKILSDVLRSPKPCAKNASRRVQEALLRINEAKNARGQEVDTFLIGSEEEQQQTFNEETTQNMERMAILVQNAANGINVMREMVDNIASANDGTGGNQLLDDCEDELDELRKELSQVKSKLQETRRKLEEAQRQLAQSRANDRPEASSKLDDCDEKLRILQAKYDDLVQESTYKDTDPVIQALEDEINNLQWQGPSTDAQRPSGDISDSQQSPSGLQSTILSEALRVGTNKNAVSVRRGAISDEATGVQRLQARITELERMLQGCEDTRGNEEALYARIAELVKQLKDCEDAAGASNLSGNASSDAVLRAKITELEKKVKAHLDTVNYLRDRLKAFQVAAEKAKNDTEELEDTKKLNAANAAKVEDLEKQLLECKKALATDDTGTSQDQSKALDNCYEKLRKAQAAQKEQKKRADNLRDEVLELTTQLQKDRTESGINGADATRLQTSNQVGITREMAMNQPLLGDSTAQTLDDQLARAETEANNSGEILQLLRNNEAGLKEANENLEQQLDKLEISAAEVAAANSTFDKLGPDNPEDKIVTLQRRNEVLARKLVDCEEASGPPDETVARLQTLVQYYKKIAFEAEKAKEDSKPKLETAQDFIHSLGRTDAIDITNEKFLDVGEKLSFCEDLNDQSVADLDGSQKQTPEMDHFSDNLDIRKLQERTSNYKKYVETLNREITELRFDLQLSKDQISDLNEVIGFEATPATIRNLVDDLAKAKKDVDRLQDERKWYNDEISSLEMELTVLSGSLPQEHQRLLKENNGLAEALQESQDSKQSPATQGTFSNEDNVETLRTMVTNAGKERDELQAAEKEYREEKANLLKKIDQLAEELKKCQDASNNPQTSENRVHLHREIISLQGRLKRCEEAAKKRRASDDCEEEVRQLRVTIHQLQELIENLEAQAVTNRRSSGGPQNVHPRGLNSGVSSRSVLNANIFARPRSNVGFGPHPSMMAFRSSDRRPSPDRRGTMPTTSNPNPNAFRSPAESSDSNRIPDGGAENMIEGIWTQIFALWNNRNSNIEWSSASAEVRANLNRLREHVSRLLKNLKDCQDQSADFEHSREVERLKDYILDLETQLKDYQEARGSGSVTGNRRVGLTNRAEIARLQGVINGLGNDIMILNQQAQGLLRENIQRYKTYLQASMRVTKLENDIRNRPGRGMDALQAQLLLSECVEEREKLQREIEQLKSGDDGSSPKRARKDEWDDGASKRRKPNPESANQLTIRRNPRDRDGDLAGNLSVLSPEATRQERYNELQTRTRRWTQTLTTHIEQLTAATNEEAEPLMKAYQKEFDWDLNDREKVLTRLRGLLKQAYERQYIFNTITQLTTEPIFPDALSVVESFLEVEQEEEDNAHAEATQHKRDFLSVLLNLLSSTGDDSEEQGLIDLSYHDPLDESIAKTTVDDTLKTNREADTLSGSSNLSELRYVTTPTSKAELHSIIHRLAAMRYHIQKLTRADKYASSAAKRKMFNEKKKVLKENVDGVKECKNIRQLLELLQAKLYDLGNQRREFEIVNGRLRDGERMKPSGGQFVEEGLLEWIEREYVREFVEESDNFGSHSGNNERDTSEGDETGEDEKPQPKTTASVPPALSKRVTRSQVQVGK